MRDRVLDSDIVWVNPEEPGESATAVVDRAPVADPVSDAIESIPPQVDSVSPEEESASDDSPPVESNDGLFGGFGVGGSGFGDMTFGDESSDASEPPHHWSIPWSDLMMVMFVLFAVMAASQADQAPAEPLSENTEQAAEQKDRIVRPFGEPMMTINVLERAQRVVKESDADDVDIVLMEDQSVKVSVRGPMVFELGSVELRGEAIGFLDDLAAVIRTTPYRIEIVGHTDDQPVATPQFPSNWELSTARASRVARYLIESGGMAPQRFTVIGRAEYEPVTPNLSAANRSSNRRVEILITRDVLPSSEVAIQ